MLFGSNEENIDVVLASIEETLGEDYVRIAYTSLVGIMSVVFIHRDAMHHFSSVREDRIKLGFANTFGNKGGVMLELGLTKGKSIKFMNSHLESG